MHHQFGKLSRLDYDNDQCRHGSDVRKASRRCAYGTRLSAPDVLTRKTSQILPSVPHAIPLLSEPGPQIHGNYLGASCFLFPESFAGELPWHEVDYSRRTNSVHITQSIIRALFATSNITAGASAQPSANHLERVFFWTHDRTQNVGQKPNRIANSLHHSHHQRVWCKLFG